MDIEENTLYPLLRRLEAQGLLDSEWREEDKRNKRFYRLSPDGEAILGRLLDERGEIDASLDRIIEEDATMTLIDRYLRAVREQPAARPAGRHHRGAVREPRTPSSRTRRRRAAGRSTDAEQAAILKRFGNPMVGRRALPRRPALGHLRSSAHRARAVPDLCKVLTINVAITLARRRRSSCSSSGGSIWSALYGVAVPLVIQFTDRDRHLRRASTAGSRAIRTAGIREPSGPSSDAIDYGTLDGIAEAMIGKCPTDSVPYTTSALELGLLIIGLLWWLAIGLPSSIGLVKPGPGWADLYWPSRC